jgi:Zn2+/Cd2+-exporting ATPase
MGLIALRDEPREDTAAGVARLKALGIRAVMLTGDNWRTGNAIAGALGLEVQAELLPDAKLAAITELKRAGPVAMIGDGINGAPAASVGVAMGGGTDVALETADAALLKSRMLGVAELVALSQVTLSNIWQNITIALGLKAVFLATRRHHALDGEPGRHRRHRLRHRKCPAPPELPIQAPAGSPTGRCNFRWAPSASVTGCRS